MHWIDWMTLGVVVAMAIIQIVRGNKAGGMGLPFFEAAGLVVAAVAATNLSGGVAEALHLQKGIVMLVMFLVLGVGAFILGRWLFGLTGWSFQSLDWFFSLLWGIVAGWTIAHMILRVLVESQGVTGPVATALVKAPVAGEIFFFRGWNWLMRLLFKAKLGEREMWNVDEQGL